MFHRKARSLRQAFNSAVNDNLGPDHLTKTQLNHALNPPHDDTATVMHGVTVHDPFHPLTGVHEPDVLEWVARENKKFEDYLSSSEDTIKRVTGFLEEAQNYTYYDSLTRRNGTYFRMNLTAGSVEKAPEAEGPWTSLINPGAENPNNFVMRWYPSTDGKHVAYFVSEGGRTSSTLRIVNTETGADLRETITGVNCRGISWDEDGKGFRYNGGRGDHRTLLHHTLGDDSSADREIVSENVGRPFHLKARRYEWMASHLSDHIFGLSVRPAGSEAPFKQISDGKAFMLTPFAELDDGKVLAVTTQGAAFGRVVSFNPADPAPDKWQTIIPEQKGNNIGSALLRNDRIVTFGTQDAASSISVYTADGKHLHDAPLPVQSDVEVTDSDEDGDTLLLSVASFKSKGDFYTYDIAANTLSFAFSGPCPHNINDVIVERAYATSKDGTKVPMTIIRSPETKLDGTAAVQMTGYGGFNTPLGPAYSSPLMHFVRAGGIYVQTNLRGGGEYGQEWYEQGSRTQKQNVYDDFAACAEYLIDNKYTSSKRLAIEGSSNGGLLTAVSALQRPDLFGAVISEVPVADMLNLGGCWKNDYGDPLTSKTDFNVAAAYSPVQNVKPGAKYPPILIRTGLNDTTVPPWNAFKFAAALQSLSDPGNTVLLSVDANSGHGGSRSKIAHDLAETFAFMEKVLGPINQADYKASLKSAATKSTPKGPKAA